MSLDLTAALPGVADPPPPGWSTWVTTCLGPFRLGETCLHRVAQDRLDLAGCCEGCTRLVMDALTAELPDLDWSKAWWRRAGMPQGGGPGGG